MKGLWLNMLQSKIKSLKPLCSNKLIKEMFPMWDVSIAFISYHNCQFFVKPGVKENERYLVFDLVYDFL